MNLAYADSNCLILCAQALQVRARSDYGASEHTGHIGAIVNECNRVPDSRRHCRIGYNTPVPTSADDEQSTHD
jgi:hypothetical protein